MLQLDNDTPFATHLSVLPNAAGVDTLFVVLKATFSLGARLEPAEAQVPVEVADKYRGEPGTSSLICAGEVHLARPGTDVVLIGEAVAPGGRPVGQLDVAVSVAGKGKVVRVFGDRQWDSGALGIQPGRPRPFVRMPLIYERAFGGSVLDARGEPVAVEARNPVGVGLWTGSSAGAVGKPMPNLEDPRHLLTTPGDRPPPTGFGPVAPLWQPRAAFAGTYGPEWQRSRAPYLPEDFDSRFFCTAQPGLTLPNNLHGGEPVQVVGASTAGPLSFHLPVCSPVATVALGRDLHRPPFHLEKVLLEPGEARICMLWRAALSCDKQALKVRAVNVGLQEMSLS